MTKPVVKCKDAYTFVNYTGHEILSAIPEDYPEGHAYYPGAVKNGERVYTTPIIKKEGNSVETERTVYKVLSWQ